jgi:uncharacterized integral membrane protein
MKIVFRLIVVIAAIVLAVFAISNRVNVALHLWPLPGAIELPLYLLILATLLLGFLVGQIVAWIAGRHWRRELRQANRRIAALETELGAARADSRLTPATPPPVTGGETLPTSRR